MEEPLRLPNGDLIRTPGEPGVNFWKVTFRVQGLMGDLKGNITKSGANSVDWHMARKVVTEDG